MVRSAWILMLAGLLAALGCEQKPANQTPGKVISEDVRHDSSQADNTVSEDYQRTKDVFQKKLETQIDELDSKIAQLREKGRDLQTAAKANWDQKMAELDVKLATARAKLAKVVHSNVEVWKDFQKEAETAYDELDRAFHDILQ